MTGIKPDRRQVVRASLWTVPAIAVAVTAPAFAASGANLSTSTGTISRANGNPQPVTLNLTIRNSGTASTTALKVKFTLAGLAATGHTYPANWSVPVISGNQITFTYLGSQLGAGQNIPAGPFVLSRGSTTGSATVQVEIDPGGGGTKASFTLTD